MSNFKTIALAAIMTLVGASEAFADANCWCKVSYNDLTNASSASGVIKDYNSLAVYTGAFQQNDAKQTACNSLCTGRTAPDTADVLARACAQGVANGKVIRAYSAVGTREYKSAHQHGVLQRANAVYSCPQGGSLSGTNCVATTTITKTCPAGWMSNTTNIAGGVTGDGACKKQASCALISPVPANGTQISSWGFTWGNGVYFWGSAANGGASVSSCPAGYSMTATQCVKQYAATLVTPAYCRF